MTIPTFPPFCKAKDTDKIPPTEFEVQSLVYSLVLSKYPNSRGEYPYKQHSGSTARFDVAVMDHNHGLLLIVEVKKKKGGKCNEQEERYGEMTKVPVIYVRGMMDAKLVLNTIAHTLSKNTVTQISL